MDKFDFYVFNDKLRIVTVCSKTWLGLSLLLSGAPPGVLLPGLAAERWWAEQESSAKSFKPAPVVRLCQSLLSFQNSILSSDSPLPLSQPNLGCWGSPQRQPCWTCCFAPPASSDMQARARARTAPGSGEDSLDSADWETQ